MSMADYTDPSEFDLPVDHAALERERLLRYSEPAVLCARCETPVSVHAERCPECLTPDFDPANFA